MHKNEKKLTKLTWLDGGLGLGGTRLPRPPRGQPWEILLHNH